MLLKRRFLLPLGVGLAGAIFLTALYFGIMSWAEGTQNAAKAFWQDRWIVIPIILGFGVQASLYTMIRKKLLSPVTDPGPSGALMGAGGTTSTVAMVACCAHHVTDLLPILGLTAATTFLTQYRLAFMSVGLGTTLLGIVIMLTILIRERRRIVNTTRTLSYTKEKL